MFFNIKKSILLFAFVLTWKAEYTIEKFCPQVADPWTGRIDTSLSDYQTECFAPEFTYRSKYFNTYQEVLDFIHTKPNGDGTFLGGVKISNINILPIDDNKKK